MCGIAVMAGLGEALAEPMVLQRMTDVIAHRGPDAEGIYVDGWAGFGFRRLAILDLSPSGHQPMASEDGDVVVVFNGEIYNYVEVRAELQQKGYRFRSTGDTEVLLNAYREWGRECLSRLNGMWAFTILDRRRQLIFGSRDRFGEKPLYRYRRGDHVFFASEIKAILATGYYQGDVHWPAVASLLFQASLDSGRESFYRGIETIEAGSAFELDRGGGWRTWKYWEIDERSTEAIENPARAFADLFQDSVRLRMRSDVPVGVCLSGGLDSTSIICAMADIRSEQPESAADPLQAFCYQSPDFDEGRYVGDTLARASAELNRLEIDESRLWDLLPTVLSFHDEPLHSATALIGFELMRLARARGVKVVLNGQGADETLAGYKTYFTTHWRALAASGRLLEAFQEIRAYTGTRGGNWAPMLMHAFRTGLQGRVRRSLGVHGTVIRNPWLTPDFRSAHAGLGRAGVPAMDLASSLKESVRARPLPLYLRIEDRNSMAHSVEARLPFLDPRLVSLAFALPPNWKVRGPWNKFVLREAMRNRIPESVRARVDKMGFPTSSRQWFKGAWSQPMLDLLNSQSFRERGIFNVSALERDFTRHRNGEIDASANLFHAAQLEIWLSRRREAAYAAISEGRLSTRPDSTSADVMQYSAVANPHIQ